MLLNIPEYKREFSALIAHNIQRKRRILIIDDEPSLTRMFKLMLEKTGKYEVKTVNQGTGAIRAARSFKPDLILLDRIMPDMSGQEVAAKLKANRKLRDIKVIFITALVSREEVGKLGKMIDGYLWLAKPIKHDELLYCIESNISIDDNRQEPQLCFA